MSWVSDMLHLEDTSVLKVSYFGINYLKHKHLDLENEWIHFILTHRLTNCNLINKFKILETSLLKPSKFCPN